MSKKSKSWIDKKFENWMSQSIAIKADAALSKYFDPPPARKHNDEFAMRMDPETYDVDRIAISDKEQLDQLDFGSIEPNNLYYLFRWMQYAMRQASFIASKKKEYTLQEKEVTRLYQMIDALGQKERGAPGTGSVIFKIDGKSFKFESEEILFTFYRLLSDKFTKETLNEYVEQKELKPITETRAEGQVYLKLYQFFSHFINVQDQCYELIGRMAEIERGARFENRYGTSLTSKELKDRIRDRINSTRQEIGYNSPAHLDKILYPKDS